MFSDMSQTQRQKIEVTGTPTMSQPCSGLTDLLPQCCSSNCLSFFFLKDLKTDPWEDHFSSELIAFAEVISTASLFLTLVLSPRQGTCLIYLLHNWLPLEEKKDPVTYIFFFLLIVHSPAPQQLVT